jgi:hypothetical protein
VLGCIQRNVGISQQFFAADAVLGANCHAYAGTRKQFTAGNRQCGLSRLEATLSDQSASASSGEPLISGTSNGKFIAAKTRQRIAIPNVELQDEGLPL